MDDTTVSESQEAIQRTSESEETMDEEVDTSMIRQKLRESGVIERVLDDFMPCMLLQVIYGDTVITLGDRLCLSEVQTEPQLVAYDDDSVPESVHNGVYIMVMTDAEAPGGEYLHGLSIGSYICPEHDGIDDPCQRLVGHQPPRTAGRMIVFTLFTAAATQNVYVPLTRGNFSTRDFAARNAFGPPLTATFFYIKHENENRDGDGSTESLRSNWNDSPQHSKIDYVLPAKPVDDRKIHCKFFKPMESRLTPVPSSLEKKTGDDVENDSATHTIRVTYYKSEDNNSAKCNFEETSCKHEDDDSPGQQSDDESACP